jgi:hypothetical protein
MTNTTDSISSKSRPQQHRQRQLRSWFLATTRNASGNYETIVQKGQRHRIGGTAWGVALLMLVMTLNLARIMLIDDGQC